MSVMDFVDGSSKQRPILEHLRESSRSTIIYGVGVYSYVLRKSLTASDVRVLVLYGIFDAANP